jgi:hypothetical protein
MEAVVMEWYALFVFVKLALLWVLIELEAL